MKKRWIIFFLFTILSFPLISSASNSVDSEIQRLTLYAEEYETGNIEYVQLMVYMASVKEGLNEILGVVEKDYGGILKQEQIKEALGEPDEETKWVWIEGE